MRVFLLLAVGFVAKANPLLNGLEVRNASFAITGMQELSVTADVYGRAPTDFTMLRARLTRATLGGLPCEVTLPAKKRMLRRGMLVPVAERVQIKVSLLSLRFPWTIYGLLNRGSIELQGDLDIDWETVQTMGQLVLRGSGTYRTHAVTQIPISGRILP